MASAEDASAQFTLSGLERNKVYRMLRLFVMPAPAGYEVSGALCTTGPGNPSWFQNTKVPELRFRALLTERGSKQLELLRA